MKRQQIRKLLGIFAEGEKLQHERRKRFDRLFDKKRETKSYSVRLKEVGVMVLSTIVFGGAFYAGAKYVSQAMDKRIQETLEKANYEPLRPPQEVANGVFIELEEHEIPVQLLNVLGVENIERAFKNVDEKHEGEIILLTRTPKGEMLLVTDKKQTIKNIYMDEETIDAIMRTVALDRSISKEEYLQEKRFKEALASGVVHTQEDPNETETVENPRRKKGPKRSL